jgi:16S rRNA (cytosine1402-N4)-methyltransferase
MIHISVLKDEAIKFLDPKENENFIDATCGAAGHSLEILKKNGPRGKILCVDLDGRALAEAKEKLESEGFGGRADFANDNFSNLKEIAESKNLGKISGIIADIGLSSDQLERSGRGFSFLKDEPLDMRFSEQGDLTAWEIINHWPEEEILRILRDYGEERFARKIAQVIVQKRKINRIGTTQELVMAIGEVFPSSLRHGRIHFATKTFQALRIAVNRELENLKSFLDQAQEILDPGGRIAVISFHSLEDRIVKNFFREKSRSGELTVLTKKPVAAGEEEVKSNPRSRSAKLRAAFKN